jgi:ABC-type transporter Mla MlaB component
MSTSQLRYRSVLIRLWQERSADGTGDQAWRAEVEQIQTGDLRCFVSLDELWRYLRWQMAPGDDEPTGKSDSA